MLSRRDVAQLLQLIRPIVNRIANAAARVVVQVANDGIGQRGLQVGALDGEDIEDAEHFEPYGFTSVPLVGAEGVALFPNGDRGTPLVVVVSDRRYRPKNSLPGEVIVYHHAGARIHFQQDGDIEIQPAVGREVFIRSSGGTADRLVKKSEFDAHTHVLTIAAASGSGGTGTAAVPTPVTGTTKLKAE